MAKGKKKKIVSKEPEPVKETEEVKEIEEIKETEPVKKDEVKEVKSALPAGLRRVKVSYEELMRLQNENKLIGYDPATEEAIIR